MPRHPLTSDEVAVLVATFPELSWIDANGWQSVAISCDWRTWIDEVWSITDYDVRQTHLALKDTLGKRDQRILIREDCRSYYGPGNVDSINDPDDPTWA